MKINPQTDCFLQHSIRIRHPVVWNCLQEKREMLNAAIIGNDKLWHCQSGKLKHKGTQYYKKSSLFSARIIIM